MDGPLREMLSCASDHVMLGADKVGRGQDTYFIAEIGNNHNGDFFLAKRLIEEAARAGANAVKFQKRSVEDTFARELRDMPQTRNEVAGKTYGEYRRELELGLDQFLALKEIARANGVSFFATPFDIPSVDFLEKVGVPFYKIASFDVTNLPLLDYVAALGKPIILSTGMSTAEEVAEAVETVLRHHGNLVLLHCVSMYPTPDEHANLAAMQWLGREFHPLPVGYSGHERDILASLVAVAQGATVVERHLTLSRSLPGPDHGTVSVEPATFRELVENARRIRILGGTTGKRISSEERKRRDKHGKSLVARSSIPAGTVISEDMLGIKSPGYGIKARDKQDVVGRVAAVDIEADTVLRPEYLRPGRS